MALVPAPQPVPAGSGSSLVPYGGSGEVGEPLEARLATLRANREAHSRKQIWTKDPHGGPYHKVNINTGYDPLIQLPDGTERKAELGYERVKIGPTSNFVGNHMTQGAIDLVQAQLEAPAASTPPPLLLGAAAAAAAAAAGPRLLQAGSAGVQAPVAPLQPVQQYSWVDAGGTVQVEVPVAPLRLSLGGGSSSGAMAEVCCEVQPHRLELLIQVMPPQQEREAAAAAAAEEFSFSPRGGSSSGGGSGTKAGGSSASGAAAPAAATHQLRLHPLSAAVVPSRCRCFVKGPPALLPCSSSGSLSDAAAEAQPGAGESQPQEAAPLPPLLTIRFCLPPGAEALVLELAKADPQQPWEALQAPAALPLACTGGSGPPPDLRNLRKAVRRQLGRSPAAACSPCTPSPASPSPGVPSPAAALETASSMPSPAVCQALLQQAQGLAAAGQHAGALELTAAWQAQQAGQAPAACPALPAAQLHALRARCHMQLGSLKQAAAEFTAAIQLLQGQATEGPAVLEQRTGGQQQAQQAQQLCQLLLGRSSVHEQQEQLEAALADAEQASRLQQTASTAALLAAQRLRQACRARQARP
ncbi:hypothetical protein ABPG75_008086 [Micractinium tetrahymenae]